MAQTGKKINELTAITTVSNETVLPAVYVSGGNPSSTANKVSIEQISNKITNDLSTILNSKQDKLTAGDNITIESNIISATNTQYTAGTNITISEQNVISADVDALPSQAGQSGKFLTTDGTDASWVEVNVPNNVWTQDNLKAGDNVTITQIQKPVIDAYTVGLCHFDDNVQDIITGDNWPSQYLSYVSGKFGNARKASIQSGFCTITPSYSFDSNLTLDFWISPSASSRTIRLTDQMQTTSSSSTFIIIPDISTNDAQITLGSSFSGTGTETNVNFKDSSLVWGSSFIHIAYEVDITNSKVFLFVNGKKIIENTKTSSIGTKNISTYTSASGTLYGSFIDEFRVSNIVRWTSDFTPYALPYAPASGSTEYQINAIVPQGSSAPTLTWYIGNTGTTVTIADTTSASLVKVYKNGILLEPTEDYSISGTTLTLVSALESQDKITTEVFA